MVIVDYQSIAYDCTQKACPCHVLKKRDGQQMYGDMLAVFLKDLKEFHMKIDGYPYYDNLAEKIISIYYYDIEFVENNNGTNIIEVLLQWLNNSFISYSIIVPELIEMLDNFYNLSLTNKNNVIPPAMIVKSLCEFYDELLIILKSNNMDYYYKTKRSIIRQNLVEDFINYINNDKNFVEKLFSTNNQYDEYTEDDFYGDLPDELGLRILL